jgi:hypothetical protein
MSYQAMEAVQDRSKVNDPTGLTVFQAIARYADANGITADGKLRAPSMDTLAAKAHCHRNTVINWIRRLEELGELHVERKGAGRGAYNVYQILLPIRGHSDTTPLNGTPIDIPLAAENGTPIDVLMAFQNGLSAMAEMVQETREMVQETREMVQEMVHNGTSQDVLDTSIHPIVTEDTLGGGSPPPPLPAGDLTPAERINLKKHAVLVDGRSEALRLYTAVNDFPGLDNEWIILERLGDNPSLETLRTAVSFWRGSGNKMTNHIGICDWYLELIRDPAWTPGDRFKARASPNGHAVSSAHDPPANGMSPHERAAAEYAAEKARFLGRRQQQP